MVNMLFSIDLSLTIPPVAESRGAADRKSHGFESCTGSKKG